MNRRFLTAFLPPVVLGVVLLLIPFLPRHDELKQASISPDMPLMYELPGWYGRKLQESEEERTTLAVDTRFSKALYVRLPSLSDYRRGAEIVASIVYSGSDMNSSIHRPERCLPAQGHVDLRSRSETLQLADGRSLTFTRLTSRTPASGSRPALQHVNYYVFVGCDSVQSSHLARTFRDMADRVLHGYVQRWAYFQIGTYWGELSGFGAEEAESQLRQLIAELTPKLMQWDAIER